MASSSGDQEPGGFLQPTLPSPPASSVNSPSAARPLLPQPRSRPLRSGSSKESDFINHVEQKLLAISRRYENRFSATLSEEENPDIEGRGYKDIGEEIRDLDPVVDVVWISGTPSLQTAFLLTIALTVMTSLPSFPFMPRPTFQLLQKLDLAFASLLKGVSIETGEPLPGSETGRSRLSTTEKVRMRGIVERTRIAVVEVAGKDGSLADVSTISHSRMTDTEDDFNFTTEDEDVDVLENESSHRRWEMDIARVYERTIVELGMALDVSGSESAQKKILEHISTISETSIPSGLTDECRLSLLGHASDIPFLMAHVRPPGLSKKTMPPPSQLPPQDDDSQDSSLTDLSSPRLSPFLDLDDDHPSNRRSGSPKPAPAVDDGAKKVTKVPEAHALCLRVEHLEKAGRRKGEPKVYEWLHADMKLDIFLNGDLCTSVYIAESEFRKNPPMQVTFSGARFGRVVEKPWILVPSASDISGSGYHLIEERPASVDVESRWKEIADALSIAAKSYGRNERDEMFSISDYLQSLVNLPMPTTLPETLETENKRFAVIDVVITVGKGRKENPSAPYLTKPMPLKLEGFSDPATLRAIGTPQPRNRSLSVHSTTLATDAEIVSQPFTTHSADSNEIQLPTSHPPFGSRSDNLTTPAQPTAESINTASRLSTTSTPSPFPANRTRRRKLWYHHGTNTRRTSEEEMKAITDRATNDTTRLVTRSKLADSLDNDDLSADTSTALTTAGLTDEITMSGPPPASGPLDNFDTNQSQPQPGVANTASSLHPLATTTNPTIPPPITSLPPTTTTTPGTHPTTTTTKQPPSPPLKKRKHTTSPPTSPDQPLISTRLHNAPPPTTKANSHKSTLRLNHPPTPHLPTPLTPPIPHSSDPLARNKKAKKPPPVVDKKVTAFEIPALSRECVVTYAEGGDVVRQVRSERGGWFKEERVLGGLRFVVG
ncbi:MAG: hypothetical protein Q9178_005140 [Gyalolechia marmorata]